MLSFISFEEARQIVLANASVLESETCPLEDALNRVLADDVTAKGDIPPFASSAMDGYAVRTQDVTADSPPLQVIDHIAAGKMPTIVVSPGTCAKIMTGAPIPSGADAVIPREKAVEKNGSVSFSSVVEPGKHVRPKAEDIQNGEMVFSGGTKITPPVIGMLATLGYSQVPVVRPPRVAVISTGDEVVSPDREPGPGQIRNSNGPGLRAQVLEAGGICLGFDHAMDNPTSIRTAIVKNRDADLFLFSGGVSVGDHDHVKEVLGDMGMETVFWKVRQRPGKPLVFGRFLSKNETLSENAPKKALVLGLPGNPVSSAMCFAMYGRPLIQAFLGRPGPEKHFLQAELLHEMEKVENLHYFARGTATYCAEGHLVVGSTGPQGSNLYHSVVDANCVIHLPEGQTVLKKGSRVSIEWLPWADLLPV